MEGKKNKRNEILLIIESGMLSTSKENETRHV